MSQAQTPHPAGKLSCACCFIVPVSVLERHARARGTDAKTKKHLKDTVEETHRLSALRDTHRENVRAKAADAKTLPRLQIFDGEHRDSLPGEPLAKPTQSKDDAVTTVYATTVQVAEFYKTVFKRNSVDNAGHDLVSSVHYKERFDNAFWNGAQMVYGDGDGKVFADLYRSPDVIAHELTHGVTQHQSGLLYIGESGALNESISDVFGAVFRQWLQKWDAARPDGWLIGAAIMGSTSRKKGYTCLRDLANPGAKHCMSVQPTSYKKLDPAGDVHINSGIPNHAFALFAQDVGGKSWETAAQVWYKACLDPKLKSDANFSDFARLTRKAAKAMGGAVLDRKLGAAWDQVDVSSN